MTSKTIRFLAIAIVTLFVCIIVFILVTAMFGTEIGQIYVETDNPTDSCGSLGGSRFVNLDSFDLIWTHDSQKLVLMGKYMNNFSPKLIDLTSTSSQPSTLIPGSGHAPASLSSDEVIFISPWSDEIKVTDLQPVNPFFERIYFNQGKVVGKINKGLVFASSLSPSEEHLLYDGLQGVEILDIKSGHTQSLIPDMVVQNFSWHPDGSHIVFSGAVVDSTNPLPLELYTLSLKSDRPILLPTEQRCPMSPVWSPDGNILAYIAQDEFNTMDLYLMNEKGDVSSLDLAQSFAHITWLKWSIDGSQLLFIMRHNLFLLNVDDRSVVQLTDTLELRLRQAVWSPDNTRIAFLYLKGDELYVEIIQPDGEGRRVVATISIEDVHSAVSIIKSPNPRR